MFDESSFVNLQQFGDIFLPIRLLLESEQSIQVTRKKELQFI